MRTYREAIILMADWWVYMIRKNISTTTKNPLFNQTAAKEKIKDINFNDFRNKIYEELYRDHDLKPISLLEIDYTPNYLLKIVCEYSSIPYIFLPNKCHTHITNSNTIYIKERAIKYEI